MTPIAKTAGARRTAPVGPAGSDTGPALVPNRSPANDAIATTAATTAASSPRRSHGGTRGRGIGPHPTLASSMPTPSSGPPRRERAVVPHDPRDLAGDFACRREIEIRVADTDAMGHVNNASYLTYFEMARVGYYEVATGQPLPLGVHGAEEGLILADIRLAFRSPALFGETLLVETRVSRLGRTSIGME